MAEQKPDTQTSARLTQIMALLRQEDAVSVAGSLGQLLMGFGVLFAVGFVLASLLWWFVPGPISWMGWLSIYVLVLAPLLVWYERKSREDYLGNAAGAMDPNPSSHGEYKLAMMRGFVGMGAEMLVWGPRAVVDGIRGMRGLRNVTQHAAFDRAAILVLDLYKAQSGVEIKKLVHPPEEMQIFGRAIDLLDKHGWIGKSTDGKSLWLNSSWRAKLLAAMPK